MRMEIQMSIGGETFVFAREKKAECVVIVDSPSKVDFSSAELLVRKIKEISGAELTVKVKRKGEAVKSSKKVFVGTLPESPDLQRILEKERIILGSNNPKVADLAFDQQSASLYEDKVAMAKSSRLRTEFLYPEDLGEQGFIIYKPDEDTLVLCGGTPKATFYGVQTLLNHLYLEDGNLKVEDLHTEKFPIFNRPAIPYRGVFTNIGGPDHIGRNQWVKEWQKEDEYDYKGFIDWLAQFKVTDLNTLVFELSFGIAYPSTKFPECVNRYHPNVKKEFMGEMIAYAHQRFIDVSCFINFPDFFCGVLRQHPELGARQFDPSRLPPNKDWEIYQRTGENKKEHDFRRTFGTVCASNPKVMSFWEEYLEELFSRYPGLDGIMGQFAERLQEICTCDNCQKNFLKLQWKYFKRMAEIAQRDRPKRKIYNCASPGDVEILRHRNEIKNFIYLDWWDPFPIYHYGRSCPRGEWYLFHLGSAKWTEFKWKYSSLVAARSHLEGIMKRSVSYKPCWNDHFAFGEFAWNPELEIEDYAALYTKMILRKKHRDTSALYSHWIKAHGYSHILEQFDSWQVNKHPFSAKRIDKEYPHLLREELVTISSLLRKIKGKNKIVKEMKTAFPEYEHQWRKRAVKESVIIKKR